MKYLILILFVIPFIKNVSTEKRLCDSNLIKTRSCSTQILGTEYFDSEPCTVKVYPPNSPQCKEMEFGPIMPNNHIGGVNLKPYILHHEKDTENYNHNENYTVLNITFTNIKWKQMKFRFQRYSHSAIINHCRNILISSGVTLNDQSVLYYDCYWSVTDGNYNGQNYMLDFEATVDDIINRGQFYFNIPTVKMLGSTVPLDEWKPFTYIEIYTGTLILHISPPPKHIKIRYYLIEVMKACDKRTNCEEIASNTTLNVRDYTKELTYEYDFLRNQGSYYFVVTPLHDKCLRNKEYCQSVKSPTVFINNDTQQTTYICIASITSLFVASLFAYYIVLRVVRRYWCKDYHLALGAEIPSPPRVLVIYSSTNKLHSECVTSFVNYLRSEYGMDVMYDGDISTTSHGDPYIWNQETFKTATHVIYVVGPADETNLNIYDKPIIGVHQNVDLMQLDTLKVCRFKKDVMNVFFEYSNGKIPVETCHDKVFFLLKDWQKLIMYLSKNLLPKHQMMRTEKGRCFLEDLNRAKKLLNTKTNDVVIKLDNNKTQAFDKKVLL